MVTVWPPDPSEINPATGKLVPVLIWLLLS
jgi:hypothetical protein